MSCLNEQEFETVNNMEKHGGSFVKASEGTLRGIPSKEFFEALAICFHHADCVNKDKLKKAFLDYWAMYMSDKWDNNLAEQANQDLKEDSFTGDVYLK